MDKRYYTVAEASQAFGTPAEKLRMAISNGLLPGQMSHNIGDYMIKAEDLAAFLRMKKTDLKVNEKIKVLIIDDEVNFANIVKLELERDARLLVRYASWGRDGVRVAGEFSPDLCLIDFMLPDTTGLQVLQQIRGLQQQKATKVLVYSAHTREAISANPGLEEQLRALGADEFMSKSAGLRALLIKVYGLLGLESTTKVMRRPGTSRPP